MFRFLAVVLAAICVTGCSEVLLPPPPQYSEPPHVIREVLDMTGGRPVENWGFAVSGVHAAFDPHADWRWAADQSVFQFKLDESADWSLAVHLTVAKTLLESVGRQHVAFTVNGVRVGAAPLDAPKSYEFSLPIEATILHPGTPVTVTMDAGPCLPQQYGPPFCVLLHTIGFIRKLGDKAL